MCPLLVSIQVKLFRKSVWAVRAHVNHAFVFVYIVRLHFVMIRKFQLASDADECSFARQTQLELVIDVCFPSKFDLAMGTGPFDRDVHERFILEENFLK